CVWILPYFHVQAIAYAPHIGYRSTGPSVSLLHRQLFRNYPLLALSNAIAFQQYPIAAYRQVQQELLVMILGILLSCY
ncbi:hypothetical protein, partial [Sphingobacterium sp. UBA5980]